MQKRLAIVFFIVIAGCIFAVAGLCLALFLAPGFSVFGLKYIRHDIHLVSTGKYEISNTLPFKGSGEFRGDIIVETNEVPVNVFYTQGHKYYFYYYDNFDGFTTSKIDDPTLSITKNADGDCVIKTTEFKKFVYESSSSERFLNIYIPLIYVEAYSTDLTINTKSAPITFYKEEAAEDLRVPTHDELSIETESGKVTYNSNVRVTTLNYTTNNTVKMQCDQEKEVYATNYNVESKQGRVFFYGDVVGDITVTTKNGDILLINCKNLVAKSDFGDLVCGAKDSKIHIRGIVNIETKAGRVTLGDVDGNGKNEIKTGGGRVVVDKIKDGTITTKRGSITIKSINDMTLKSNVGKITVEEVLTGVKINANRGKVLLGGAGLTVNNPTVVSNLGDVTLNTASGTVDIKTTKGDVVFANKDSSNIKINSGGTLDATKLTGKVSIEAYDDVNLNFTKITDETVVDVKDTKCTVVVRAEENTNNDTLYHFKGSAVYRYEDEVRQVEPTDNIQNDKNLTTPAKITITGANATIHVYFKKA